MKSSWLKLCPEEAEEIATLGMRGEHSRNYFSSRYDYVVLPSTYGRPQWTTQYIL